MSTNVTSLAQVEDLIADASKARTQQERGRALLGKAATTEDLSKALPLVLAGLRDPEAAYALGERLAEASAEASAIGDEYLSYRLDIIRRCVALGVTENTAIGRLLSPGIDETSAAWKALKVRMGDDRKRILVSDAIAARVSKGKPVLTQREAFRAIRKATVPQVEAIAESIASKGKLPVEVKPAPKREAVPPTGEVKATASTEAKPASVADLIAALEACANMARHLDPQTGNANQRAHIDTVMRTIRDRAFKAIPAVRTSSAATATA